MAKDKDAPRCEWQTLNDALTAFVKNESGHQGAGHIKPLHWYVASRLVLEGGFDPDDITPRPPFVVQRIGKRRVIEHDETRGEGDERTVLGGLKTKNIDVVVTKDGIGPVIAVSMKGTLKAFRNLTNRMEEAVGDCTNLHISYPALVYGFLHVLCANHEDDQIPTNDVVVLKTGHVAEPIRRYCELMSRLAGRNDIRDVTTKYEAVSICLVDPRDKSVGEIINERLSAVGLLDVDQFFSRLYDQYDQRFVYAAPLLAKVTRRHEWDSESPAITDARAGGYSARIKYS